MIYTYAERFGNGDGKAINRHIRRFYVVGGVRFWIDKCTDIDPKCYELWTLTPNNIKPIPVDSKKSWGVGLAWTAAENLAYTAIQEYLSGAQ